jgi:acetylornithine deacetylase/succinyl-diaminopimelate desuccinylase-like protein
MKLPGKRLVLLSAASLLSSALHAQSPALTPVQKEFRATYQELVETNTTNSTGSCTNAVTAMAARLKAGGYSDAEMQIIVPPDGPAKGNLVARLKGSGASKTWSRPSAPTGCATPSS